MIDVTIKKRFGSEFLTDEELKTLESQVVAEKLIAAFQENPGKFIGGAVWDIDVLLEADENQQDTTS